MNERMFAGKHVSNTTSEERYFYTWLKLGRKLGKIFYQTCLTKGPVFHFLKNEVSTPFTGMEDIPSLRLKRCAENYVKEITNILKRFTDFDEYGPVYDHADDNAEISNADIQTWECAVLKSFTYLVKNEFEISVDGEGD